MSTIPMQVTPPMVGIANSRRIALVEDHSLFAEALAVALEIEGYRAVRIDMSVGTVAKLLIAIRRECPGIVLLDLDLGAAGNGVQLIKPLAAMGIKVVVVTGLGQRARWGEAIAAGACKVISKSAPLTDLFASISRLVNGLPVSTPEERSELLREWSDHEREEGDLHIRLGHLTHGEAIVLGRLMEGKQVVEIARERFVSESTIRTQVKSVLAKLQVSSQLTAVGVAHRARWRAPSESTSLVV